VTIKDSLPSSITHISNQALVNIPGVGSMASDDPDTPVLGDATKTAIAAAPLVHFAKDVFLVYDTDHSGTISPGDVLEYVLTLINTGTRDATDIALSDTPDPKTRLGAIRTSTGVTASGATTSTFKRQSRHSWSVRRTSPRELPRPDQ
jgi:uncharacterized repeat protein (TIGR01451 family)